MNDCKNEPHKYVEGNCEQYICQFRFIQIKIKMSKISEMGLV